MREDQIQRTLPQPMRPAWLRIDLHFWFDQSTWSAYMAFVLLVGIALLVLLPNSQRIADSLSTPPDTVLFPALFVVLYGILAMTLGQAEIEWQERLRWPGSLFQLLARQLMALSLTLPYWLILLVAHSLSLLTSLGVFLHFSVYGLVLGLFGWRLAQTRRSEIFQFNLKYLIFTLYLIGSFFIPGLNYLNPLWPLDRMLGENRAAEWIGLFIQSYLVWAAVALLFGWWTRRCLMRELMEEGRVDGINVSGH